MTKEKFEEVAQAYGGDFGRWPVGLREEVALFVAAEPEFVRRVLAREARLDAALDELQCGSAATALYEPILASASDFRSHRPRWRFWVTLTAVGAALAGVAAAGVLAGAQVVDRSAARAESAAPVADLDLVSMVEAGSRSIRRIGPG